MQHSEAGGASSGAEVPMNAEELRKYVLGLRVAELKSVLNQLSLPSSGKKQILQTRIFHYFGESFCGVLPSHDQPVKEEWRLQAASEHRTFAIQYRACQ